jgi:glutaminyl-peptide cyclotransferase
MKHIRRSSLHSLQNIKKYTKKIISFGSRLPGSQGHSQTLKFCQNFFSKIGWAPELDVSKQKTPDGNYTEFKTLIATRTSEPHDSTKKRIILCTHYDSKKLHEEGEFVGATDAIIPMAIIMELAKRFSKSSRHYYLQCIFFDGEGKQKTLRANM